MSAPKSYFLKWLIGRLARGAVPVDGVQCSDRSDAPRGLKTPASGPEEPQPTAAELDRRQFPTRWANFR